MLRKCYLAIIISLQICLSFFFILHFYARYYSFIALFQIIAYFVALVKTF